jgi:hypothetical protein
MYNQIEEGEQRFNASSLSYTTGSFAVTFPDSVNSGERYRFDGIVEVPKVRGGLPFNVKVRRAQTHADDDFPNNVYLEHIEVYNPHGLVTLATGS